MLPLQAGATPERRTILLVEDEVLIRLMLAEELRSAGFHVLEASNADEAWTILASSLPVHLLLTDIHMPGRMDGAALAGRARAQYPQLKLVITSSLPPRHDVLRSAASFFAKPYDLHALVRAIEELLPEPADGDPREP